MANVYNRRKKRTRIVIDTNVLLEVGWLCVALVQIIDKVRLNRYKREHWVDKTWGTYLIIIKLLISP